MREAIPGCRGNSHISSAGIRLPRGLLFHSIRPPQAAAQGAQHDSHACMDACTHIPACASYTSCVRAVGALLHAGGSEGADSEQQQQLQQQPWEIASYFTKQLERRTNALGEIIQDPDTVAEPVAWTPDAKMRLAVQVRGCMRHSTCIGRQHEPMPISALMCRRWSARRLGSQRRPWQPSSAYCTDSFPT
jgi:hypothetical protein